MTRPLSELHAEAMEVSADAAQGEFEAVGPTVCALQRNAMPARYRFVASTDDPKEPAFIAAAVNLIRDPRLPDALRLAELAVEASRLRRTCVDDYSCDKGISRNLLTEIHANEREQDALVARLTAREGGANG